MLVHVDRMRHNRLRPEDTQALQSRHDALAPFAQTVFFVRLVLRDVNVEACIEALRCGCTRFQRHV